MLIDERRILLLSRANVRKVQMLIVHPLMRLTASFLVLALASPYHAFLFRIPVFFLSTET
jgi:hypothetical protein